MIKVLIADDHDVILEGLKSFIESKGDSINIIGKANNGKEVIALLKTESIDVAILDINMPEMDGLELTKYIRNAYSNTKVLIISMHNTPKYIKDALHNGANGYILKEEVKQNLIPAIKVLFEGGDYFTDTVKNVIIHSQKSSFIQGELKFTKRELEILKLIANSYSSREIAQMLSRSIATINTHRKNLIEKTGLKNSKELIHFAIKNGYD